MRIGLIIESEIFIGTTGVISYLQDYISLYEKIKYDNPEISEYSVISFSEIFLLKYEIDNEIYILGDTHLFKQPGENNQPCKLEMFEEALKIYLEGIRERCNINQEYWC